MLNTALASEPLISDNDFDDSYPSLYDGKVAWVGHAEYGNPEIYYFDGMDIIRITDNKELDYDPSLYNGKIAWQSNSKIFLWDGVNISQISDEDLPSSSPSLYNGEIAFVGFDIKKSNHFEIYYWNGAQTKQITVNDVDDTYPCLSNGKIAWQGYDGNDFEIYFWNGETIIQITDNDIDDLNPVLSNELIAWEANMDIYCWDGTRIIQIPDTGKRGFEIDRSPSIFENKIAWIKTCRNGDIGIYLYDLGIKTGLLFRNEPNYTYSTPSLYNDQIAVTGVLEKNQYTRPTASIYLFDVVDGSLYSNTGNNGGGCFLDSILKYLQR